MAINDITKQELEQANGDLVEAMYLKQPNNYRYNYSIDTGVPLEANIDDRELYRYVANKITGAQFEVAKNFTLADAKGGQKVIVKTYQMLLLCLILIIQETLMAFIWTHQIIKLYNN